MTVMKSVSLRIITSPGCTHCHDFLQFWDKIKTEWLNVDFREVSALSQEGQELAMKHFIFASPGIIMNDVLVSSGEYSEKEILEKLRTLSS